MRAVKVMYILSDIDKALAFEWITDRVDKAEIDLRFILIGKRGTALENFLKSRGVIYYVVGLNGKKDLPGAWIKVFRILREERPAVVHSHLYYGNIIGLSAAWLLGISKRIYTRHHAALHHHYFPRAVKIDKLINRFATQIVALCQNSKKILIEWEEVDESKVYVIPHGFDLRYFKQIDARKVKDLFIKYGIDENASPVIGVISRYTHWKGIQFVIPAFEKLKKQYPGAHLILANTQGDYAREIKALLKTLPDKSYTEIKFESDIASLYGMFDLFIHVPIDAVSEAFGQTYVEALAAGVPSIFTLSGIACDFIRHGHHAYVVPYQNSEAISDALITLLTDKAKREVLVANGLTGVEERFSLENMVKNLVAIYKGHVG